MSTGYLGWTASLKQLVTCPSQLKAATVFTRCSTVSLIRCLFSQQTKRSFHLSQCWHLVGIYCLMCSRPNFKKSCCGNQGVRARTSRRIHNPVTIVTTVPKLRLDHTRVLYKDDYQTTPGHRTSEYAMKSDTCCSKHVNEAVRWAVCIWSDQKETDTLLRILSTCQM